MKLKSFISLLFCTILPRFFIVVLLTYSVVTINELTGLTTGWMYELITIHLILWATLIPILQNKAR